MNNNQLIVDPFLEKWRGKYPIVWCDLCDIAIIICPECHNGSCNGGGCDVCINDQDAKDFNECKVCVEEYLSEAERIIYKKSLRIKHHIMESLALGEKSIDWEKRFKDGKLNPEESLWFR